MSMPLTDMKRRFFQNCAAENRSKKVLVYIKFGVPDHNSYSNL